MKVNIKNLYLNLNHIIYVSHHNKKLFYNGNKMFNCNFKSSQDKKRFYQNKKLEMFNYIKDSLERKLASVTASIDVLESQINRDKELDSSS